jgi:hypothetical protein
MGQLRDRMEQDLKLKGVSPATIRNYLLYCRKFAAFYMRSPDELGASEIRAFLLHQIEVEQLAYGDHCSGPNAADRGCVVWSRFLMNTADTTCDNPDRNAAQPGGDAADVRRARQASWQTDSKPRITGRRERFTRGYEASDPAQAHAKHCARPLYPMTSP